MHLEGRAMNSSVDYNDQKQTTDLQPCDTNGASKDASSLYIAISHHLLSLGTTRWHVVDSKYHWPLMVAARSYIGYKACLKLCLNHADIGFRLTSGS